MTSDPRRTDTAVPSYAQERRVRADRTATAAGAYRPAKTLPLVCQARGRIDVPALEAAVAALVRRHAVLRHRFHHSDGSVSVEVLGDTAAATHPTCAVIGRDELRTELDRPFELLGWPLFRVGVVQGDPPLVYLSIDHVISDGWSLLVIQHDLEQLYDSAVTGRPIQLPPTGDFADHAAAERRRFADSRALHDRIASFQRSLGGRPADPPFPVDLPAPGGAGRYVSLDLLDGRSATRLARWCRSRNATVFMGTLAALGTALGELTGLTQVGMTFATDNRETAAARNTVGWYANMLPLYFAVGAGARPDDTLRAVRTALMEMLTHHDLPRSRVRQCLPPSVGDDERAPGCFVSFSDERAEARLAPDGRWTRILTAPAYENGYGIWFSLSDTGLRAEIASPGAPAGAPALDRLESLLVGVLRRYTEQGDSVAPEPVAVGRRMSTAGEERRC